MHRNSLKLMRGFAENHARPTFPDGGCVLDVGSANVNGCYRDLWGGWDYFGVDIAEGRNVDEVVPADTGWTLGRTFDVVISGQCMEHVRRPWELAETMGGHLSPGGLLCLIAPFSWEHHRYPIDCYRYAPDGMGELIKMAGCEVVQCKLSRAGERLRHWTDFVDCIGIGRKLR